MKPTVGRAVHYHSLHMGKPLHATILETDGDVVTQLSVIGTLRGEPGVVAGPLSNRFGMVAPSDTGLFIFGSVPFAETPTPGHWSWPPVVR